MTSPYLNTPTRTEAEARTTVLERQKAFLAQRRAGENVDQLDARLQREAKLRFELACREAVSALEDGGRSQFIINDANGLFADFLGDWWADVEGGGE
jgi:hypothetical protein